MPDKIKVVCGQLAVTDFDPTTELDSEVEQFLRVNAEAYRDCLPQYIAHVIQVSMESVLTGSPIPGFRYDHRGRLLSE